MTKKCSEIAFYSEWYKEINDDLMWFSRHFLCCPDFKDLSMNLVKYNYYFSQGKVQNYFNRYIYKMWKGKFDGQNNHFIEREIIEKLNYSLFSKL